MAITFDTFFKIGAVFTGQPAMDQAKTALTDVQKKGFLAGQSIGQMGKNLMALVGTYATVSKVTGYINNSINAARNAKAAYEGIGTALSNVPKYQKEGAAAIKKQQDLISGLAKEMQRTGLIAQESLGAGFAKLLEGGMSPDRVHQISGAFQDLIIRVDGVKASQEQVVQTSQQLSDAIVKGGQQGADSLKSFGLLSDDQVQKFANMKDANERYNYVLARMNEHVGDTAQAMKTWEGARQRFGLAVKDISVAIGTPFMAAQDKITEALTKVQGKLTENAAKISESITPIISKYADKAADFFVKLIESSDKWGPKLDEIGKLVEKAFGFFVKHPTLTATMASGVASLIAIKGISDSIKPVADVASGITKVSGAMETLITWGPKVAGAISTAFVAMGPAGWITLAIAAFIAALVLIITHWKEITEWIGKAVEKIKEFFGFASKVANPLSPESQKAVTEAVQASRESAMTGYTPGQRSEADRLKEAHEKDVAEHTHAHTQALRKVIAAEHEAQKQQAINTAALKESTDKLYGKSPGFIPGLQDSIEALSKFETSLGQISASMTAPGGAMGGFGLGAGGMPGETPGTLSLGAGSVPQGGVGGRSLGSFGYIGDATPDSNSLKGVGAYNQHMIPGYSAGLSYGAQRKWGIKPGQEFMVGPHKFRLDDTNAFGGQQNYVDVYNPAHPPDPGHAGDANRMIAGKTEAQWFAMRHGGVRMLQYGGVVNKPSLALMGEKSPEMAIPLEATSHSRGLVGAAAEKVGMGTKQAPSMLESALKAIGINLDKINIGQVNLGKVLRGLSPGPAGAAYNLGQAQQEVFSRLQGAQLGGMFSHPGLTSIAERVPEMVVPLEGSTRSRSLLSAAASMIGFRQGAAGGGHTNLSMHAPITINGVATGNEAVVAKEVQRALRDPIRGLLDELRKAKLHEQRLAYA
jgi:hypothetical protein